MDKLRSLEMVRAGAALLVILFHIQTAFGVHISYPPFENVFAGGHRGVDLFFVLSGFIIAYVHGNDLGRPDRLKNYVFNRIARIYPAVWIMSVLAIVVYAIGSGPPDKMDKLAPGAILASAFLLPQHGVPLVNVTWTLTYELFFYALFAVLIVNVRLGVTILLAWQVATAAVALLGFEAGLGGYYLRAICLDFGVGLACAGWLRQSRDEAVPLGIWSTLLAFGLTSFIVGMWLDAATSWAAILCALGAGSIIVSLVRLEQAGRLHVPDLFVLLGGASYAIYLVHYSVIQMLSAILRRLGVPETDLLYPVYVAAGILAGLAFDQWVDRPIQRRLRRLKAVLFRSTPRTGGLVHGPGRMVQGVD